MEIEAELGDELDSRLRVADRIDRPHDFLRVPRVADLAFRVAGLEQPDQLQVRLAVETLMADGHQLARSIERIGIAAALATRLVLYPRSDLVEQEVRELHDMEGIGDLDRMREHRVEHRPIRTRQIQRRPTPGPG